jgi:hypothetical protein
MLLKANKSSPNSKENATPNKIIKPIKMVTNVIKDLATMVCKLFRESL